MNLLEEDLATGPHPARLSRQYRVRRASPERGVPIPMANRGPRMLPETVAREHLSPIHIPKGEILGPLDPALASFARQNSLRPVLSRFERGRRRTGPPSRTGRSRTGFSDPRVAPRAPDNHPNRRAGQAGIARWRNRYSTRTFECLNRTVIHVDARGSSWDRSVCRCHRTVDLSMRSLDDLC